MSSSGKSSEQPPGDPPQLYKVFVSSTYLDNKERRKLVQDAVTSAGMIWIGMELFTASTHPTVEECRRLAGKADVKRVAWYRENSGGRLHPEGEKEPNGFGLYDMHGNVWE